MPICCAVINCKVNAREKTEGIRLFSFPKISSCRYRDSVNTIMADRRQAWIKALKRGKFTDEQIDKMRICSLHFIKNKPANFKEVDHPDWVPSVNMGYFKRMQPPEKRLSRYDRRITRNSKVIVKEVHEDPEPIDLNRTVEIEVYSENMEIELQSPSQAFVREHETEMITSSPKTPTTPRTFNTFSPRTPASLVALSPKTPRSFATILKLKIARQVVEIESLKKENQKLESVNSELLSEIEELKLKLDSLNSEFNAENLGLRSELRLIRGELAGRNDEVYNLRDKLTRFSYCSESFSTEKGAKKLLFYSGIQNIDVFNIILGHLNAGSEKLSALSTSLDSFQTFLLVLMKLRLSTSFRALGYKFNISERTASAIFQKGIILMYHVLHRFIHWPTREELLNSVPQCFLDTFGKKVSVIIDCFEIPIQKPNSLMARAQTFSQYKQKNTVKYLIGIAPCGAVSFISDGWGGRTSDKRITESSGILDLLEPGDIVLADRGFTVNQEVGLRYATLKTPAFTEGKPQLAARAIEDSRKVSSVRIHVERVIGTLRNKFKILNGPVPITLLNCNHDGRSIFDYTVSVCCALTNMCDSIVTK